jgi:uncharacterized protein DUF6644
VSMLPFFEFCEQSALGEAIRNSLWLFPVIESAHLLALAMVGGSILVVDLRLFGVGLQKQPVSQLARDAQPWLVGSLLVMVASGIPLFMSEALKCYYHAAFWVKMTSLLLAILFTFTVRRKVAAAGQPKAWLGRLVAISSLTLWSAVGIGGRWIGFS